MCESGAKGESRLARIGYPPPDFEEAIGIIRLRPEGKIGLGDGCWVVGSVVMVGELILVAPRCDLTDGQTTKLMAAAGQVRIYGRGALLGWRRLVSKSGWATGIRIPHPSSEVAGWSAVGTIPTICSSSPASSASERGPLETWAGFTLPVGR